MNKKYSKGKKLKKEENDLIKINEIEYLEQLLNQNYIIFNKTFKKR